MVKGPLLRWFLKYGAMSFSIIFIFLSSLTAVHIISITGNVFTLFAAVYCYGQIVSNWIVIYRIPNRDRGCDGEQAPGDDYFYCPECKIHRQKMSFHCSLCKVCVLRQDHHCFFLGTCVGLNNQHHFTVFCLYTGLGTLYLCYQIYTTYQWSSEHWYNYLELVMPFGFVLMLFKAQNFSDVYLILLFNTSVSVSYFCLLMFALQVYLLSTNQTWFQFSTKRAQQPRPNHLWRQFRWNFGQYGLLNFLAPLANNDAEKKLINPPHRMVKCC